MKHYKNEMRVKDLTYPFRSIQVKPEIQSLAKELANRLNCPIYEVVAMSIIDLEKKLGKEES